MASFVGGLTGGLATGIDARKEKSFMKRLEKSFGRNVPEPKKDDNANDISPDTTAAHKGGRIAKTAVYRMKKGEVVIPADVVRDIESRTKGSRKPVRKSGRKSSRR